MIITKDECKRLIRQDSADYDELIEELIPIAQQDLCAHLENHFRDPLIRYAVGKASFVRGNPDTITDDDEYFVRKRFAAGMDVYVESQSNTGIYELATVAAGTLTLTSVNELVSMAYNDDHYKPSYSVISRIMWPASLRLVVARMVSYLIIRHQPGGELSENLDGVVMQYDRRFAYPREITEMAEKYRRPSFV